MRSQEDSELLVVLDVRSEDEYQLGYAMPSPASLHAVSIQASLWGWLQNQYCIGSCRRRIKTNAGFCSVLLLVTASDAHWCSVSTARPFLTATRTTIGCLHRHLAIARNISLPGLTADAAQQWHSKTVVIVGSGDFRSQQACTRLSQVFKLQSVFHLVSQAQIY